MSGSCTASLTFWPATPVTAGVARAQLVLGIDVRQLHNDDHSVALSRTEEGELALQASFTGLPGGLRDLKPVLERLRAADTAYVAWDMKPGEISGTGVSFQPGDDTDFEFTVLAGGEPVLRLEDLDVFEGFHTGRELLVEIRRCLQLPLPPAGESLSARGTRIVIQADEGSGSQQVVNACKRAGLPRLSFHELRHTFGTQAIRVFKIHQVQRMMGHRNITTTERYLHYTPDSEGVAKLTGLWGDRAARDGATPPNGPQADVVPLRIAA